MDYRNTREEGDGSTVTAVAEGLFPIRFFGFGFFWAWLFLAGVTPSPLIGAPFCFGGAPFEMVELSVRALWLVLVLLLARRLASVPGQYLLLAIGVGASALAAPLVLMWGDNPVAVSLSAVAAGAGEVSLFLLWLCFFGYMKLGETFVLLVGSYAIGSLLFLLVAGLGLNAMALFSVLFPLLSGAAFVLSQRLGRAQDGSGLFRAAGAPPSPLRASWGQWGRIGAALALYSFAFSLSCGIALFAGGEESRLFTVEPVAMVVLGIGCGVFFKKARHPERPYGLYRIVAPLIGLGFLLMVLPGAPRVAGGFCVALGYVLFELLILNDCCNIVKANDASLLRVMAVARLIITIGMFLGWLVVFGAASLFGASAVAFELAALGLFVALVAVSLVLTERELATFATLADDRALSEAGIAGPTQEELVRGFAEACGLSRREGEVAFYLLAGRTTSFAAEKLFIAESTVRAHVHGIYRKCDVHSRMEPMDAFDEYRTSEDAEQGQAESRGGA